MLKTEQVEELQQIYFKKFGIKIPYAEAYDLGIKLINLIKAICINS